MGEAGLPNSRAIFREVMDLKFWRMAAKEPAAVPFRLCEGDGPAVGAFGLWEGDDLAVVAFGRWEGEAFAAGVEGEVEVMPANASPLLAMKRIP